MKKIICFTLLITIISTCFFACISREEDLGTMVYASPAEQDAIYDLIIKNGIEENSKELKNRGLTILKESITPVYSVDMIEYAKTGNLKMSRDYRTYEGCQWKTYIAKTITSDGQFGGNVTLRVSGNKILRTHLSNSSHLFYENANLTSFPASCSYADHAERIRICLGKSEIIPVENVRYLDNDSTGMFYVKDGDKEYFIPVGYEKSNSHERIDAVLSISDMEALAQEYLRIENENQKSYEEFQKTHPGQSAMGRLFPPVVAGLCSRIDNIINIYEYLGIEATAATEEKGN